MILVRVSSLLDFALVYNITDMDESTQSASIFEEIMNGTVVQRVTELVNRFDLLEEGRKFAWHFKNWIKIQFKDLQQQKSVQLYFRSVQFKSLWRKRFFKSHVSKFKIFLKNFKKLWDCPAKLKIHTKKWLEKTP